MKETLFLEVEFKGGRTIECRNPMEFPFKIGDNVIVEVENGEHFGQISYIGLRDKEKNPEEIQYKVIRKASPEDHKKYEDILEKEREAIKICKQKVQNHGLPMKLVDVEYQFDMRKLTFYFTADGRVDFRELVKDLAAHFRVRIELRQIGVRDETKRLGGFGICGQQLCCTTFLNCFNPITTQMAKVQNLSLNPQKLSGLCGRLKCCMRYELDYYLTELKDYPNRESVFKTPRGEGMVEKIDIFTGCVYLKYPSGDWDKYDVKELKCMHCVSQGPPIDFEFPSDNRDSSGNDRENTIKQTSAPDDSEKKEYKNSKKEDKNSGSKPGATPFPSDFN